MNQLNVFSHDVHVVLFMNLLFFFKTLLKTSLRVFKISSLVFILLLDIWINFNIFHFLIFYVRIKIFVDSPFKLIKVVNVLDNPVDSVLELFNKAIISSNLSFILLDEFTHVLLSSSKIINDIT